MKYFLKCLFIIGFFFTSVNNLIFSQIDHYNSHSIKLGLQFPLQWSAGYEFRFSKPVSVFAQANLFSQPFYSAVSMGMKVYGVDSSFANLAQKSFLTSYSGNFGIHFYMNRFCYLGVFYQYLNARTSSKITDIAVAYRTASTHTLSVPSNYDYDGSNNTDGTSTTLPDGVVSGDWNTILTQNHSNSTSFGQNKVLVNLNSHLAGGKFGVIGTFGNADQFEVNFELSFAMPITYSFDVQMDTKPDEYASYVLPTFQKNYLNDLTNSFRKFGYFPTVNFYIGWRFLNEICND